MIKVTAHMFRIYIYYTKLRLNLNQFTDNTIYGLT